MIESWFGRCVGWICTGVFLFFAGIFVIAAAAMILSGTWALLCAIGKSIGWLLCCKLRGQHVWRRCSCRFCSAGREHVWKACTCERCGRRRDSDHVLDDDCRCTVCADVFHVLDDNGDCARCGAKRCEACQGTGATDCGSCGGEGYRWLPDWQTETCGDCLGLGKQTCSACNGRKVKAVTAQSCPPKESRVSMSKD